MYTIELDKSYIEKKEERKERDTYEQYHVVCWIKNPGKYN